MNVLIVLGACGLAAIIAFTTNWLALIPWRRARNQHWTERARLYYPVRVAAAGNIWALPAVLTIGTLLVWPDAASYWVLMVPLAGVGAIIGTLPMTREVFPRIAWKDLWREAASTWALRLLMWCAFLIAVVLMPDEFNTQSLVIAGIVVLLLVFWNRDGWIWVGQRLGLFSPPPARLQAIVRDTAAKMNVQFREVCLVRSSIAQAAAMPASRRLLFTERLLELLSDDEVAAVCAHELGHLTESRIEQCKRYVVWLMFLPWIFFNPVTHALGFGGIVLLAVLTLLAPVVYRRVSHRLEIRADTLARAAEPDAGAYARGLARLYEDGLLPAVNARKRATHPHLYDRLVAAGVTPDFPRPQAADTMAWHGRLIAGALGVLVVIFLSRMLEPLGKG